MGVTAKLCEDFDQAMPAGPYTLDAAATIDTTKPFSGTKSVHYKKPARATFLTFSRQFPVNDMWGRLMLFMANPPKGDPHWDFIRSDNGGKTQWSIGGQFGNFELVCDPPDNGLDSKTPFPGNAWVCIQWHFGFDPATRKTAFLAKVNGQAVDKGMFNGPVGRNDWVAGPWSNLQIGWEVFGSTPAPEFWVDDVAFGDQEIPCPAPPK
jgi:hypothetical protein